MLVAPLVLDLDSRINLNVVGNVFAKRPRPTPATRAGAVGSQHGQGAQRRQPDANGRTSSSATAALNGRYGPGGLPSTVFALSGPPPHVYAPGDLNGLIDPPRRPVHGGDRPVCVAGRGRRADFPTVPRRATATAARWKRSNAAGTAHSPDVLQPDATPQPANQLLPLASHASLLWAGVPGSPNSDLVQLCPINFNAGRPDARSAASTRRPLLSMDLDRPGASPYVCDRPTRPTPSAITRPPAPTPTAANLPATARRHSAGRHLPAC